MPFYCISCMSELLSIDDDPNGDKNSKCVKCHAEEDHDFDAEPDVKFNRDGTRKPKQYYYYTKWWLDGDDEISAGYYHSTWVTEMDIPTFLGNTVKDCKYLEFRSFETNEEKMEFAKSVGL